VVHMMDTVVGMKNTMRNIMSNNLMELTVPQFTNHIVKPMKNLFVKLFIIQIVFKCRIKNVTLTRSNHAFKHKNKSAVKNIMNFALMPKILNVKLLMRKNVLKFLIRNVKL